MKNIKSFLFLTVLALFIVSCNNNSDTKAVEKQENNNSGTSTVSEQAPSTTPINSAPINKVQSTSPSLSTQTAPGMNPPHGQPGHDCKISVGAPLNSSIQNNSGTSKIQRTSDPRLSTQTAPGMNPPHGQPGHDCKISVGAPLNSGK